MNQPAKGAGAAVPAAPESRKHNDCAALGAAMLLATVANMCIGLAPVSMGALVKAGTLTNADIGRVGTVEVLLLALGAAIGPRLLRSNHFRSLVALVAAILTVVNVSTYHADAATEIYLLRTIAGLAEGIIFACLMIMTVSSRDPERVNATYLAVSTIPQVAAIYLLSDWLFQITGAASGFGVMAGVSLFGLVLSIYLPRQCPQVALEKGYSAAASQRYPGAALAILIVVILQNAAIACVWYYLGRLAELAGASPRESGFLTITFLVTQFIAASSVASRRSPRQRRFAILELSIVLLAASLAFPFLAGSWLLLPLVAIYGFFQIILSPLSLRLLLEFDTSGRAGEQLMAMTLLGLAGGAFLSSFFVTEGNVTGSYLLGAGLMIAGGVLSAICVRHQYYSVPNETEVTCGSDHSHTARH